MTTSIMALAASSAAGQGADQVLSFSERFSLGFQMMGFGMAVVFSILMILWGVLALFRVIFYKKPAPSVSETDSAFRNTAAVALADPARPSDAAPDDRNSELAAAITAAIVQYRASNEETSAFRVVSFKKRK